MVSSREDQNIVYNIRLSSVGPGRMTGEDVVHEPTNLELAMKLHYLRGVYYFKSQAFNGLTILKVKESMFPWLNHYYWTCGRMRRSESGRPYIKCNDCGVRFIEAQCDKTIDEWMDMKDGLLEKKLVYNQVIGPELTFSPPVLIQLTKFGCGGFAVGLSMAHILGDPYFAAEFINTWGYLFTGDKPLSEPQIKLAEPHPITETPAQSLAVKNVGPVGDHWTPPTNTKMVPFSVNVNSAQLNYIQSKLGGQNGVVSVPPFEALCAVIWRCVAKVKGGTQSKVVTICRNENNEQVISSVKADFSVTESNLTKLASLLMNQAVDERDKIADVIERENGLSDVVVYGANLTFVNLENGKFYDLKVNGENPIYVSYIIDGIGEEGVVLVLPQRKSTGKDTSEGRVVNIILPESQASEVKFELEREFSLDCLSS
ncbi:hypothetical protein LguiB_026590 [Lonicera macranthoides]